MTFSTSVLILLNLLNSIAVLFTTLSFFLAFNLRFFTIYFKALRFYKCFDEEVLVIDQWKHSGRTSKPRVHCVSVFL